MRRSIAVLAGAGLLATVFAPVAGAGPGGDGLTNAERQILSLGGQVADKATKPNAKPAGANPYLALVPDPSKVDFAGWKRHVEARADAKARQRDKLRTAVERAAVDAPPLVVDEDEPEGMRGSNDSTGTAQPVPAFGTRNRGNPRMRILGTLSPEDVAVVMRSANAEDDGSITLAGATGIGTARSAIQTSATIGDGPHGRAGSGSGDFDFYALRSTAGETLTVTTSTPTGPLDTMVAVFNDAGEIVAFNDDSTGLDSRVSYTFPDAADYYVMVTGFFVLPDDPFDSSSGTGADSEGPYTVQIKMAQGDVDFYGFRLRKGDVVGASVDGAAAQLTAYDPASVNVHGSTQDATFIYPAQSPLPGGGNAVTEHVANETGWHYLAMAEGDGDYDVTVEAYRPALESERKAQTIFLDFDGARINTGIFGGPGVRTLSPLQAFLGPWGLTNADYDELVDRVVGVTTENLRRDMVASGLNDDFRLRIRNSRDHNDPWGNRNVSRVIVGGTIEQSGIPTIGIAQSIDPGNFGTQESALVLLDVLSGPATDDASLNAYLTPASDRVAFIGQAVANVTSHEAGHFFGNWHVDQFNEVLNLMDQGGNFPLLYGVGPDGVGGTADDPDVDFGEDVFNPNEGFTGIEDTLTRLVFALTS